ncbi:MAG: SAM-dependent methyltransferase [Pseudomonadota bacterium]
MTTDEDLHAARVLNTLRQRIAAAGGWIAFDEYMKIALYEPGLGYYSAGARKLGAGGDFTTAPEISPLFGQCLAAHCDEVLRALGGGDVVEIGAGTGRLACDVLVGLDARGRPPRRYLVLEISADLRDRQRACVARLPVHLAQRVEWLDAPPAEPWQGALLANEVLDALPVQRFRGDEALGVSLDPDYALEWQTRPADAQLSAEMQRVRSGLPHAWPDSYESELCLLLQPWLMEVTASMQRGVALFIDYGLPRAEYFHPDRSSGTLRCHYRQTAHDNPFAHPGLEDVTAWVDFTRVAEASDAAGLEVLGYATQSAMLLGLGIEAAIVNAPDDTTRIRRASEARQLLLPNAMGETFKAMALGRGYPDAPLSAFSVQDLRDRL